MTTRPTLESITAINARNKASWTAHLKNGQITNLQDAAIPEREAKPKRVRKQEVERAQSNIERMLEVDIEMAKLPAAKRNYRAIEGRKFEIDFAWPDLKLACEVQGMAHRIKERFEGDIEKRALTLLAGWTVLEVSGKTIRDGTAITWLETLFKQRMEGIS